MLKISVSEEHGRFDCAREHIPVQQQEPLQKLLISSAQIENPASTWTHSHGRYPDFCKVFLANLDSFYQLSFLLTTDPDRAEQCILASLHECVRPNHAARDSVQCWAKRTLVEHAIRALRPQPDAAQSSCPARQSPRQKACHGSFDIASVLSLPDFDRFAFVLSVLEEYSDRDCALLLDCLVDDVQKARTHALQQLAASLR